jgi:hypothetical protein
MRIDITECRPFGENYEMLTGRAHYVVEPAQPCNADITDLALAPQDAAGHVRFSGDIAILRPVLGAGNRRLLFDWGNRGNKRALAAFNDAPAGNDPRFPDHAGNGFLMRRGYTVVWGAWQGDLLPGGGRMLLDVPVALGGGGPIRGPVRTEFIGRPGMTTMPLSGAASTRSHPAASLDTREAVLTRRRYADSPREPVPAAAWCFARLERGGGLDGEAAEAALVPCRESIHLPGGFRPGWIYELVYTGEAPLVLGLAHAAVRDLVSFLRHGTADENPLRGTIDLAYGWGRSQTGRAIRDFVYRGFNADTRGRRVFDGVMPHVSGAGRLNTARFASLNTPAGQQHEDHDNPADCFPFAYGPSQDHLTGRRDAILKRPKTDPLVLHTQSATEYWQRRGSLVHTDTQGNDLPVPPGVRVYLWASSQHAAAADVTAVTRGIGQNLFNVVAVTALFRAMLDALDAWVTEGVAPPASRIPTRADGTLVDMETWKAQFPAIPGVALPHEPSRFALLDFGPQARQGIISREPPEVVAGAEYTVLVPAVDADGNDVAGVRAPMVAAPLATYTGWNLRAAGHGEGAMNETQGSTIPFAETEEMRRRTGDKRPPIAARYPDAAAYVAAIGAAARALAAERLLLEEDVARAEAAAAGWGAPRHDVGL